MPIVNQTIIGVEYDLDTKEIVIRIPYDGSGNYSPSESGKTYAILPKVTIDVELDTGLNVPEYFFLPVGVYRYVDPPKSRRQS